MLLGPSAAGLALTALLKRRELMSRLGSRVVRWRVSRRWRGVALMTMPLLLLVTLWPFSVLLSPVFSPRFQRPLFAIGLIAGGFEEIGWTGLATPHLLARQRLLIAGLSLGLACALCAWVGRIAPELQHLGPGQAVGVRGLRCRGLDRLPAANDLGLCDLRKQQGWLGNGHGSRRPEVFQRPGNPRPGPAGFGPAQQSLFRADRLARARPVEAIRNNLGVPALDEFRLQRPQLGT